jgi:hypothetical protein
VRVFRGHGVLKNLEMPAEDADRIGR